MKQSLAFKAVAGTVVVAALAAIGCNGSKQNNDTVKNTTPKMDSANSTQLKINNQIFSIPSPVQTAMLIKKGGYTYNKSILNVADNYHKYDTKYKKALNLGVYGADLGYISLYNQTQDALAYMASLQKLASDVGVGDMFSPELVKRFNANMGNQDSLLAMVSDAFKKSDSYFKDHSQKDVSSLILIGGWIESLYFAIQANNQKEQKEIVTRIAEQKISLVSLVKMLQPYASQSEFAGLAKDLGALSDMFDNVEFAYNYVPPTVDAKNKTTSINSTSTVKITPEQLKAITDKVLAIRNQIVG